MAAPLVLIMVDMVQLILMNVNAEATGSETGACCRLGATPTLSEPDAEALVALLKALADPIRLRLVNLISHRGEVCACDLPDALDRSQPTVSHHLKVLTEAGILTREQRGRWAWFSLCCDPLKDLAASLSEPSIQAGR